MRKIWLHENDNVYPGIIVNETQDENIIVLKFDYVWRKVQTTVDKVKDRTEDFSEFMFNFRRKFLTEVPIKWTLPK
ncbi:MAG TPA: hypothetical protein PKN22_01690 [Taishania sp.]|nr:hypothetical protein [Taishania sp.]